MFSKNYRTLIPKIVFFLFVIALAVFHFNYKLIIVDGISMYPTYHDKQLLLAVRSTDNILTNNVIVFSDDTDTVCIKRVIAKPGDTVTMENKTIKVNNNTIRDVTYESSDKSYTLNDDEYYVIGDNWRNSYDSRTYGPINIEQIQGVIQ